ncbi:MAG: tetratricopeptide repeat protein [Acidobacteriia bacterium]|nr:tetratricopeptide repeat protein [Terriglobia bacterium]
MTKRLPFSSLKRLARGAGLFLLACVLTASVKTVCQTPDNDVFAKGVQAYNGRNYTRAEALLSGYLKQNPHAQLRDIALLWYGRTLIALHRFTEAENVLAAMQREYASSPLTTKLKEELQGATKKKKAMAAPAKGGVPSQNRGRTPAGSIAPKPARGATPTAPPQSVSAKANSKSVSAAGQVLPHAKKPSPPAKTRNAESLPQRAAPGSSRNRVMAGNAAANRKRLSSPPKVLSQARNMRARAAVASPPEGSTSTVIRPHRDPFRPLITRPVDQIPENLPPGKRGLIVSRIEVRGIVKTTGGYLAVVQTSNNPVAIFLHDNDQVYDGQVRHIYDDHIVFLQTTTDRFGRPVQEEVTKRLTGPSMFQ